MGPLRAGISSGVLALVAGVAASWIPRTAAAQVPAEVEIRDGRGSALVRNGGRGIVDVEAALWESDETGENVELIEPADVNTWPTKFRLEPGDTQTVRFLADPNAYPPGTLLRLETRFIPVAAESVETAGESAAGETVARLTLVTRILSKVHIQ